VKPWWETLDAKCPAQIAVISSKGGSMAEMRQFETGATRDVDTSKYDYEGFVSPLVIERYAEYMHANRLQRDGKLRDSDNWQKGIPKTAYMKSMWRHFMDVWLHHRGLGHKAKEPLEIALCGLLFNVCGYLHETLKYKDVQSPLRLSYEPGTILPI
jgi:hypothetical protein